MKKILMIALLILLPSQAWGTVYYVSSAGDCDTYDLTTNLCTGGSATCRNNIADYEGISLQPGDTVYIRGGTYAAHCLDSAWSGSAAGGYITFQNYTGETPTFTGTPACGYFFGISNNYIKVSGLTISQSSSGTGVMGLFYVTGNYNVIDGCTITQNGSNSGISLGGSYNQAINNDITYGYTNINSGWMSCSNGYNRIANNTVRGAEEYGIVVWSDLECSGYNDYTEVYNNTIDAGYENACANGMSVSDARQYHKCRRALVDSNIVYGFGYTSGCTSNKNGIQTYSDYGIFRYNVVRDGDGGSQGSGVASVSDYFAYNRWYNNTFYNNLYSFMYAETTGAGTTGNKFLNNIFYKQQTAVWDKDEGWYEGVSIRFVFDSGFDNDGSNYFSYNFMQYGTTTGQYAVQSASPQWVYSLANAESNLSSTFVDNVEATGGPKFTNETSRDLTLQSDSPCKDAGTWLTQANGSGSTTTSLIVDDSSLFFYSAISSEGDQIAIGSTSNVRTISAINHTTKTLTLSSPATWNDNEYIYLYKKFWDSSTVLLSGSAPDIGAYEYTNGGDTTDPTCTITTNSGSNYTVSARTINLAGTASDDVEVSSVAWACATCTPTSGSATGTTSWTITSGQLAEGANTITVTATDSSENTGSDSIVITYDPPTAAGCTINVGAGIQ